MKLEINSPCHENWDTMKPNEKGAFCLSCQKNVVDFSKKSLLEIKNFFTDLPQTEKVCAKFKESQLEELTFDHFFSKFKSWHYIHKAAIILYFIFGFSLFGCAQSKPKPKPEPEIKMGIVAYEPTDNIKPIQSGDTIHRNIKGKVKYSPDRPKRKQTHHEPEIKGDVMIQD